MGQDHVAALHKTVGGLRVLVCGLVHGWWERCRIRTVVVEDVVVEDVVVDEDVFDDDVMKSGLQLCLARCVEYCLLWLICWKMWSWSVSSGELR